MTHVKARAWIKPLPAGRDSSIDAGCKDTLQALWDHVDWNIDREPVGKERPWASAEVLAQETGERVGTVRDRLRKLTAAGWIRYMCKERCWALAWMVATPVACDSGYTDLRPELHEAATPVTSDCDSSRTNLSHDQDNELSQEQHHSASAPDVVPSPLATSTPTTPSSPAEPGPDACPSGEPGSAGEVAPSPSKPPRTPKPKPKPGQGELPGADPPESSAFDELLALHENLRRAAQAPHGQRETALPAGGSGRGASLRARLRKALREHEPDVLRGALEFRGAEWRADPGALLQWSTDSMWSPKSLAVSIRESSKGDQRKLLQPRRGSLSCHYDDTRPVPKIELTEEERAAFAVG
jgi:hypothetical protein